MAAKPDTYDWVETGTNRYILIKKQIGSGWLKVGEVRNKFWAQELTQLLNVGQKSGV